MTAVTVARIMMFLEFRKLSSMHTSVQISYF